MKGNKEPIIHVNIIHSDGKVEDFELMDLPQFGFTEALLWYSLFHQKEAIQKFVGDDQFSVEENYGADNYDEHGNIL